MAKRSAATGPRKPVTRFNSTLRCASIAQVRSSDGESGVTFPGPGATDGGVNRLEGSSAMDQTAGSEGGNALIIFPKIWSPFWYRK